MGRYLTNCPASVTIARREYFYPKFRPVVLLRIGGLLASRRRPRLSGLPWSGVAMIATVQITESGAVVACLDTDDLPGDDDERQLSGLLADNMLDQCARVAIDTFFELRDRADDDDDSE